MKAEKPASWRVGDESLSYWQVGDEIRKAIHAARDRTSDERLDVIHNPAGEWMVVQSVQGDNGLFSFHVLAGPMAREDVVPALAWL